MFCGLNRILRPKTAKLALFGVTGCRPIGFVCHAGPHLQVPHRSHVSSFGCPGLPASSGPGRADTQPNWLCFAAGHPFPGQKAANWLCLTASVDREGPGGPPRLGLFDRLGFAALVGRGLTDLPPLGRSGRAGPSPLLRACPERSRTGRRLSRRRRPSASPAMCDGRLRGHTRLRCTVVLILPICPLQPAISLPFACNRDATVLVV